MAHPEKISRGVKLRPHHNNDGRARIRAGKTTDDVMAIAKKLGLKYKTKYKSQREKDRAADRT
ncbi:hypothetical protein [Methylocystis iwaonis]|uniref:hypothetical protein n=1 Tax=Methylocystis iwaonis TaxID=2885079 RepID=UPI002E7AF81B|nr:hypothetical protein [Methylocystis iwaonis]